ncbi:MAG: hypothetical protein AB8G15_09120, partial [Saprospiraceae bacterium]
MISFNYGRFGCALNPNKIKYHEKSSYYTDLLCHLSFFLSGQVLLNQAWLSTSNAAESIDFPFAAWNSIPWQSSLATSTEDIVMVGDSNKSNGGTQLTILKLTTDGQLLYKKEYLALKTYEMTSVNAVVLEANGNVYLVGSADRNGNRDFLLLLYNANGNLKIEQFYNGENDTKDIATD